MREGVLDAELRWGVRPSPRIVSGVAERR